MMTEIYTKADELIETIKESDIYKNYVREKERVKNQPELKARIDEYRTRNYVLQSTEPDQDIFIKIEQLKKEYGELLENPIVNDFLGAELAFCRMIQDVIGRVIDAIEFE